MHAHKETSRLLWNYCSICSGMLYETICKTYPIWCILGLCHHPCHVFFHWGYADTIYSVTSLLLVCVDYQDIQAHVSGEIALHTSDTVEHDISHISPTQIAVYNSCCDTTKHMNGIVVNMHPSEGVWLFRSGLHFPPFHPNCYITLGVEFV